MTGWRLREHTASILVAALSCTFGVALLQITGVLGQAITSVNEDIGSETATLMLQTAALLFIGLAVFVATLVTANTFATIVAGRTRIIALRRLIGATAGQERRAIAAEGAFVGGVGVVIGAVVGTVVSMIVTTVSVANGWLLDLDYSYLPALIWLPPLGVLMTTVLAAWSGSRGVLAVTPVQAIGRSDASVASSTGNRAVRAVWFGVLVAIGGALLAGGLFLGLSDPRGVLVAFVGGVLSFVGVVVGAPTIMPWALRVIGRMLGRSVPARIAAANATRHPERSARLTISLTIGVTLITTLLVASESFRTIVLASQAASPESYEGATQLIDAVVAVFALLIGVSAVLAGVGLVNALSLSVLQRTRELGLLRALGMSARQLRGMITAESVQYAAAGTLVGLALGVFYGWAGAQSLLGSAPGDLGFVAPAAPVLVLVALVAAAALLALGAAIAPARRATRLSPVAALAAD